MFTANLRSIFAATVFAGAVGAADAAELNIVGTGDGLSMLQAIATAFEAENPGITALVPPSIGSGGGIAAVGTDAERLGRVARPLKDSEVSYGLVYVPIAKIPSAIIAHPSTDVSALTSAELRAVYAGEIKSWSELNGADARVRVVRREEADSTLQVLRATMPGWADLEITPRSKLAVTTQDALKTVHDVEGAIGFGPYSRSLESQVNVLKIDGKSPNEEGYPSFVVLALIYKKDKLDAEMSAFVDFSLSEAAAAVISDFGGIPIR